MVVTKPVSLIELTYGALNILLQAAVDIMEKQSVSLVDRPRLIAAGEILSGGLSIVLTPAGDKFRRMRRFVVCNHRAQMTHSSMMQCTSYASPASSSKVLSAPADASCEEHGSGHFSRSTELPEPRKNVIVFVVIVEHDLRRP